MSTYVYSPYGSGATPSSQWDGSCTYGSAYCSGGCHASNQGTRPLDIQGSAGDYIDFWCDPGVLCLKTISYPGDGCGGTYGSPWDDGVKVQMWSGAKSGGAPTGVLIGEVFFAHLDSPFIGVLDTGWDAGNVLRGWSQWARIASASGCTGACNTSCYSGPHIHMAAITPTCYNTGSHLFVAIHKGFHLDLLLLNEGMEQCLARYAVPSSGRCSSVREP